MAARKEIFILALCFTGALHVWFYAAALPFFTNLDEREHFDTIVKYARGTIPQRGGMVFDKASKDYFLLYGIPDYICKPEKFPRGIMPPPLCAVQNQALRNHLWEKRKKMYGYGNHEAFSPPVYYLIAAGWYNLGKLTGQHGIELLYWVRFLNAGIMFLTVLCSYLFCKRLLPDSRYLQLGVPCIIAFLPQSVFYAINNDVLSPLVFTVSLYLLLQWYCTDANKPESSLIAGLSVALVLLTKFTNVAIFAIALILCIFKITHSHGRAGFRQRCLQAGVLMAGAVLPVACWCIRNKMVLGDYSGSMGKVFALGWKVKPLGAIFHHPIFTFQGIVLFWHDLITSFWRGEIVWHMKRLSLPAADLFYSWSSFVFLSGGIWLICSTKMKAGKERLPIGICLMAVAFSICFFILLSVIFDFGLCLFPSMHYPYFTAGRLLSGIIVPFLVIYLQGLSAIMNQLKIKISPVILVGVIVFGMAWSEIILLQPVFLMPYNWFHISQYCS